MRTMIPAAVLAVTLAAQAFGAQPFERDQRIETMCGKGHQNELVDETDFVPNPAGFYVKSVNTQLEPGDPRIVLTAMDEPWLCTRPAGNPSMSHGEAAAISDKRVLKFLFIPAGRNYPASFGP